MTSSTVVKGISQASEQARFSHSSSSTQFKFHNFPDVTSVMPRVSGGDIGFGLDGSLHAVCHSGLVQVSFTNQRLIIRAHK
jgi:hypothetical protein